MIKTVEAGYFTRRRPLQGGDSGASCLGSPGANSLTLGTSMDTATRHRRPGLGDMSSVLAVLAPLPPSLRFLAAMSLLTIAKSVTLRQGM